MPLNPLQGIYYFVGRHQPGCNQGSSPGSSCLWLRNWPWCIVLKDVSISKMHLEERGARRLAGGAVSEHTEVWPITEKNIYSSYTPQLNIQTIVGPRIYRCCCVFTSSIGYQNYCCSSCIPWWRFTLILPLLLHFATVSNQIQVNEKVVMITVMLTWRLNTEVGYDKAVDGQWSCATPSYSTYVKRQGEEVRKGIKDVQTEKWQEGFVQSNSTGLFSVFSGWSC